MMPDVVVASSFPGLNEHMTVTHVGSNKQYASNWENIFAKGAKRKAAAKAPANQNVKKKAGKKSGKK